MWVLGEGCWVLQMALGVGRGLVRALRFMTWGNRCGNPPPPRSLSQRVECANWILFMRAPGLCKHELLSSNGDQS